MDIKQVLERAQFETEERQNWIAVFDRRPEFRTRFSTPRIGKVQDGRCYITPRDLTAAVKVLITGAGHQLHHLPSSSGRDAIYPGFDVAGCPEKELDTFFAILRNVVNSHINSPPGTKIIGLSDLPA
jgi:hypothetical protein